MATPTTTSGDELPLHYTELKTPRGDNRLETAFALVDTAEVPSASKQELTTDGKLVSLSQLLSYADTTDYALMGVGSIGGLLAGMAEPLQIVLFGDVLNSFNPSDMAASATMRDDINAVSLNFVFLGISVLVAGFVQVACWSISASRQAKRIRSAYVSAIITKEIGWFDVNEPMQLATRAGIKKGIAVGWGMGLMFFTMFCTYAGGLYFGAWKVANDNLDGNTCTGGGCYDGGKIITVFFSVVTSAMAMGQAGPSIQAIFSARAAAFDVFSVIKR
ncbi:hypothetical protein PybrP1_009818, partial [[Pythium] brassicae (nom. inval.)]